MQDKLNGDILLTEHSKESHKSVGSLCCSRQETVSVRAYSCLSPHVTCIVSSPPTCSHAWDKLREVMDERVVGSIHLACV